MTCEEFGELLFLTFVLCWPFILGLAVVLRVLDIVGMLL
jgi:hypothetical protein